MNPKTRKAVINQMALDTFNDTYADILAEQEQETKPSRTIRSFDVVKKKNKYEKPRNPKHFDDYDE